MSSLDDLKAWLGGIFATLFSRVDYSAMYGATVAAQNDDGSLELKPSTTRLPPLSNVPIRYGIPAVSVKVNPGALVVVGFDDASPAKYFAMIVGAAGVQSISIMGGTQPVARAGDPISFFLPEAIPFTGTISELPAVGVITVLPSPAPGIILNGNPLVTA